MRCRGRAYAALRGLPVAPALRRGIPLRGTALHPPALAHLGRFPRHPGCVHAREGLDYFENSRRATYAHQRYAIHNPKRFKGYGELCWGITASEGPGPATLVIDGVERRFFDYVARSIPRRAGRRDDRSVGRRRLAPLRARDRAPDDPLIDDMGVGQASPTDSRRPSIRRSRPIPESRAAGSLRETSA